MRNRKWTIFRAIFFCLLCAVVLTAISGLTKNLSTVWKQHLLLILVIVIVYYMTIVFAKWEKLALKDIGVVFNKATVIKVATGFGIGLFMALLQPAFVFLSGHYKIVTGFISFRDIIFYLSLYFLVAIREELAFRGYPLFSLNRRFGPWTAQMIVVVLFSLEHIAGGMAWGQAFLGAGTGALLFGFAALRTNGIALPIGIHAAWNFGQWCVGFKKEAGLFHGVTEKGFESVVDRNGWISYLVIMAVAILAFYFYKPKNRG